MMRSLIALLALGLLAGLPESVIAQSKEQPLATPVSISTEFLTWIGKDEAWLQQALADQGQSADVTLGKGIAEARTEAAAKAVNRIRGFAYFAAPGLRPPYFDLTVAEADGSTFRCVTLFPESVAPGIGPMDFNRATFPAAPAKPSILDLCRVKPAKGADFVSLDRTTFRERYFDQNGNLRDEFSSLNSNPAFIAEAFDHGFFVLQGDLTGRLLLDRE
jgi:hypothetical protein